jgi:predicted XRE-type DNA-binding protein
VFGLSGADAIEMDVRRLLNAKIVSAVRNSGLTHAEVAKLAGTSRTRLTAIVNGKTIDVSTDLMLRIVRPRYRAKLTFTRSRRAA